MMIAHSTGSELHHPLGVAVFGGLVVSQILTLFSTPVNYIALDRFFSRSSQKAPRLKNLIEGVAPAE